MPRTKGKLNILLDLDQTLICACDSSEYKPKEDQKIAVKADNFDKIDMDNIYMVFERPHLQEFLDFLFKNFNVSVWNAASKDYALFIIENIILKVGNKSTGKKPANKRNIDWIFFSYHCDISKNTKKGTKDLSILWENFKIPGYSIDNSIIVDDYHEVYKTQPGNCIQVSQFNFTDKGSEKDKQLRELQIELELTLKQSIKGNKKFSAEIVNQKLKVLSKYK